MRYTPKELTSMTDMEYDIIERSISDNYMNYQDNWKSVQEFWEDYIRDMEEYNPWRD